MRRLIGFLAVFVMLASACQLASASVYVTTGDYYKMVVQGSGNEGPFTMTQWNGPNISDGAVGWFTLRHVLRGKRRVVLPR